MIRVLRCAVLEYGLIALCATTASASAQSAPLDAARELYASAAYEEALVELDRLSAPTPENVLTAQSVRQYRALCLLALGRTSEAERAIEDMIKMDPAIRPADVDAPPRLLAVFTAVRRRLLPADVLRQYTAAKAQFEAREFAAAAAAFERVLRLLRDPELNLTTDAKLSDVATLATGFLELARNNLGGATPPAAVPSEESARPRVISPKIVPPQTVYQELPAWREGFLEGRTFTGEIEISISDSGAVSAVKFVKSVHPIYDRLLEQAAAKWKYTPALKDGRPVPSTKTVMIRVSPRR